MSYEYTNKRIERGISIVRSVYKGKYYVYHDSSTHKNEKYLSLESARERRRNKDWNKDRWVYIGLEDSVSPVAPSRIDHDLATGKWYVSLELCDDVLVSSLYSSKEEAISVKEWLDKEGWTKTNLNKEKRNKNHITRKYFGILPVREGYMIKSNNGDILGVYNSLDEATTARDDFIDEELL